MENAREDTDRDILMEDVGEGIGYLQEFVSQEVELIKLEVAEKISIASSSVITGVLLMILGGGVFTFACIAFALYLGDKLGSNALGFTLVSVLFAALLLVVYFFRKPLINDRVVTAVIQLFFDPEEYEKN